MLKQRYSCSYIAHLYRNLKQYRFVQETGNFCFIISCWTIIFQVREHASALHAGYTSLWKGVGWIIHLTSLLQQDSMNSKIWIAISSLISNQSSGVDWWAGKFMAYLNVTSLILHCVAASSKALLLKGRVLKRSPTLFHLFNDSSP